MPFQFTCPYCKHIWIDGDLEKYNKNCPMCSKVVNKDDDARLMGNCRVCDKEIFGDHASVRFCDEHAHTKESGLDLPQVCPGCGDKHTGIHDGDCSACRSLYLKCRYRAMFNAFGKTIEEIEQNPVLRYTEDDEERFKKRERRVKFMAGYTDEK